MNDNTKKSSEEYIKQIEILRDKVKEVLSDENDCRNCPFGPIDWLYLKFDNWLRIRKGKDNPAGRHDDIG